MSAPAGPGAAAAVHAIDTGRLVANGRFLRAGTARSLLRPVRPLEFPVLAYVIEHPEGVIAIDTGLAAGTPAPRRVRGFPPAPMPSDRPELAAALAARGIEPSAVRRVLLTHLDWDHTGGLARLPDAEVLVHRPEWRFAHTRPGRLRYRPSLWPADLSPTLFDLEPEPYGPFPASRALTERGDVRIVPLPGHSPGQVGVVYEAGDVTLLFAADHALRADWFSDDVAAGRLVMLGAFGRRAARMTSERVIGLLRAQPTVLLPAHDPDAPSRLDRREPTSV